MQRNLNEQGWRNPGRTCDRGQVLVLFACFLTVLLLFVGLGVDIGFAYLTQARLAKAVDAAALAGISNFYKTPSTALQIAQNVFTENFSPGGKGNGYIQGTPTFNGTFSTDSSSNEIFSVSASAKMKTFFIGVLPQWKTLAVSDSSTATRTPVVMTLVLDHSYSMDPSCADFCAVSGTGCTKGGTYLPAAVTNFVSVFDEGVDHVSVVSFGSTWNNDVPMTTTFKTAVADAVNNMDWTGYTCSEIGLTNAMNINNKFVVPSGQNVTKIIVFFTDGLANGVETELAPALTCNGYTSKVTNRWNLATSYGFDGQQGVVMFTTNTPTVDQLTPCAVTISECDVAGPTCCGTLTYGSSTGGLAVINYENVGFDATNRCLQIAEMMRQSSNYVYCVGFDAATDGDVPTFDFLQRLANDQDNAAYYNSSEVSGQALITGNGENIAALFQQISDDILVHLTH